MWIAAGKPESVRDVAALGANLLLDQFASPQEIITELQALQAVGVRSVLISGGEARESMRRFAADVMPAFCTDSRPGIEQAEQATRLPQPSSSH